MPSCPFRLLVAGLAALALAAPAGAQPADASSQPARIVHDGRFADWAGLAPAATDPADQPPGTVDLRSLTLSNDASRLRLRIAFDGVVQLQENNDLVLHLDTDADPSTGRPLPGMGADLSFAFGDREGTVVLGGTETPITHASVGLSWAPTFAASEFEVEVDLDAVVGGRPVFPGDDVVVALVTDRGERLPQGAEGAAYTLDRTAPLPPYDGPTLDRPTGTVRLLSYNVLRDNVFEGAARDAFGRIVRAIAPDVVAFQEVYDNSGAEAAALVAEALGGTWYAGDAGSDNLIVSRTPIDYELDLGGNSAFRVRAPGDWAHDLLVINAHTPCCGNEGGRLDETDRFMGFLRDVQASGVQGLDADLPTVIVGDMNLVGTDRPLRTMLTGDLVNNTRYGPDFAPDLDGTDLADALPLHLGAPAAFTWYRAGSRFPAGRLDYVVYMDSVLELENAFVLYTPHLSADALAAAGLRADDTDVASDHLPLVADVRSLRATSASDEAPTGLRVAPPSPNPFAGRTALAVEVTRAGAVVVDVFDALGRRVARPFAGPLAAGTHRLPLDGTTWAPGVYLVRVTTPDGTASGPMVRR